MNRLTLLVLILGLVSNCTHMNTTNSSSNKNSNQSPFDLSAAAPIHPKVEHRMELHGDVRIDPYFWMKKRDSEEVLKALNSENEYYDKLTNKFEPSREQLFQEMKARVKEDDSSVPYLDSGYWYYSRFQIGDDYPIYSRKKGNLEAPEEILLNVNKLAEGKKFTEVGGLDISDDDAILAYAVDHVGRRFYDIIFVDMKTKKLLPNQVKNTSGSFVWSADSRYLFYTQQNPETLRSEKVFRFDLKSNKSELIYHEKDELFNVGVSRSKTKKYLFLYSGSFDSSEIQFLPADKPTGNFEVFLKREAKHEYDIDDASDGFFILSNWQAENFRLLKAPYSAKDKSTWREVVPHRKDTFVTNFQVFKSRLVLGERFNGLTQLRVLHRETKSGSSDEILSLESADLVRFPDPTYVVGMGSTPEYDSKYFRYNYQSMVRPASVFDFDFATKQSTVKKTQEVPTYQPELYKSERIWATASDGTKIPISLVYKASQFKKDSSNPLFVYGYGSYGYSMDAGFRASVVSMLDRGFVYAILHVRGGSEMGRQWYEQGRMLNKKNTFSDFVEATDHLIKNGYGSKDNVFASGGSAGGLLMGAIMNLRPELYKGLIFDVPFVDVLTTMLDPDIPLTAPEYEQWGNPNEKKYYDYIKSYSPYDQLKPARYPHVYVFTGYHDSQVQYWEPAKFVAKLRDVTQSGKPVLFRVDMNSGHGGPSGRFQALRDVAHEFSFILELASKK